MISAVFASLAKFSIGIQSECQECVRKVRTLHLRTHYKAITTALWKLDRKYGGTFGVIAEVLSFLCLQHLYYNSLFCLLFFFQQRISASARIQLYVSNTTFTAALPSRFLHTHTKQRPEKCSWFLFSDPKASYFPCVSRSPAPVDLNFFPGTLTEIKTELFLC